VNSEIARANSISEIDRLGAVKSPLKTATDAFVMPVEFRRNEQSNSF
jgi:hypothetical protein